MIRYVSYTNIFQKKKVTLFYNPNICHDSEAAVQQAVSKWFQKFFLVYFALRDPLILINEYILLCILSVAESTEPSIYTTGTTFWNLPEVDGT